MKYSDRLDSFVDWFIGGQTRPGSNEHRRLRMFLISHLCGPFLGHPITAFLYLSDPHPWPHVYVLGASITLFWLFPLAGAVVPQALHAARAAVGPEPDLRHPVGLLPLRRRELAVPDVAAGRAAAGILLSGIERDHPPRRLPADRGGSRRLLRRLSLGRVVPRRTSRSRAWSGSASSRPCRPRCTC